MQWWLIDILNDIANQQGVSGGVFTPDQSFINLSKKGILTFYSYWYFFFFYYDWYSWCSEECSQLVENELCFAIQQISIPLFDTCPLFKKRLLECVESLIHVQTQKTIDLIRQLIAMELNFINVHHPDFIGTNIEKVRVEATEDVRTVSECNKYNN